MRVIDLQVLQTTTSEKQFWNNRSGFNTSSLANSISAYQIKAEFLAPTTADYSKTPALKNIRVVTWR